MIIYYDGSNNHKKSIASWGIHAYINGQMIEQVGHKHNLPRQKPSLHETFALVESVKLAHLHQVSAKDATFYTDDEVAVYASHSILGPAYMLGNFKQRLFNALDQVEQFYSKDIIDRVLGYVTHSRFVKVKAHTHASHSRMLGNFRADYLSNRALKCAIQGTDVVVMDYDTWTHQPFNGYQKNGEQFFWSFPFTS